VSELQTAAEWHRARTLHHSAFPAELVAATRKRTVSVCLPARNEAATIGPILEVLLPLRERGVLDQVVVVDDSTDGTAEIARRLGAETHAQSGLRPELGPVLGKGDAMWRALSVLTGEVVCFLDADSEDLGAHFALGLVGPLACGDELQFVKGCYRRPLRVGDTRLPEGGGRVSELLARPLLNRFFPELAGFLQPLAGEVAGRRDLLERLPFALGYAVDVALLIDAWRAAGLWALAQVDLDCRQNRHQPLVALGPMAAAVLAAVTTRLERDGRLEATGEGGFLAPLRGGGLAEHEMPVVERPPFASLAVA
jgi:glucosyl-3-phosphoglycerate synthase